MQLLLHGAGGASPLLRVGSTGEGDRYLQPQHPLPRTHTAAPGPAAEASWHPPRSPITCSRESGFWGHWLLSQGWLSAPGVPWAPQGCPARLVGCRGRQQGAGQGSRHGKCCRQDVYPAAGWELHCSWSGSELRQWGLEAPPPGQDWALEPGTHLCACCRARVSASASLS